MTLSTGKGSISTGKNTTRTGKVFALSLGGALSMLASLAFSIVGTRWLSKHDYATVRQTFLAYDFVSPLLMLGLPNAIYYFLPRSQGSKRGIIIDNIALLVGASAIFSLFIALGGSQLLAMRFNNQDLHRTLQWLIPYPLFLMPVAGFAAVMVCAGHTKTLAGYNVVSQVILAIAGITAIVWSKSYIAPILVRIIIPAIFFPIVLGLIFKSVPGQIRWPKWSLMNEMMRYSIPLGFASMLGSITLQLHSVIVAALCAPEDFAVYINGAMEIPAISIITGSITTVVFAEMADMCAKGDKLGALKLFHVASIKSASILFPIMCFLLVVSKPFIIFLYSVRYYDSITPFIIYLFVLPARIVVYGSALMALGMTRVILIRSIFDLLINCILCFMLVKMIGYIGAAIATILTLYSWTIPFNLVKISYGFGVRWQNILPFKDLFKILLLSILCIPFAVVGLYSSPTILSIQCLIAAILYCPVVGYLLYRNNFLILPEKIEQLLPCYLRVQH
jgi:O-antigen/teichoic acid export membrane protein